MKHRAGKSWSSLKDYLKTFDLEFALGQVIRPSTFNAIIDKVREHPEILPQIMEAVLRSQTQAYYTPQNVGHFGLALGSYAHFTSPIRRYADLIVHRALVSAYDLEMPAPKDNDIKPTTGLSAQGFRTARRHRRNDQQGRTPRDGGRA